jgi:hypothetical protein
VTFIVYHFTNLNNWTQIRLDGFIRAGASHVHPRRPEVGGLVVHATTNPAGAHLGIEAPAWMKDLSDYDQMDKTRIRIAIEVSKKLAPRFVDYCQTLNAPPTWIPFLEEKVGGSIGQWRSIRSDVPRESWLHVLDMYTGSPVNMAPIVGQDDLPATTGGTK